MKKQNLYHLPVAIWSVLVFCIQTQGREVRVDSQSVCRSYGVLEGDAVEVVYNGDYLYDKCEIEITNNSSLPRLCIQPISLKFGSCYIEVETHYGFVIEDYEEQKFDCLSNTSESKCTYLDSWTLVFRPSNFRDHRIGTYLSFKIYPEKSEFAMDDDETEDILFTIKLVCSILGVLVFLGTVTTWCCCRRNRQTTYGNGQAAYSDVQYHPTVGSQSPYGNQTSTTLDNQPSSQGFKQEQQYGVQPPFTGYSTERSAKGFQYSEPQPTGPAPEKDVPPPPYPGY